MTGVGSSARDLMPNSTEERPDLPGICRDDCSGRVASNVNSSPDSANTTIRRQARGDGDPSTSHDDDLLELSELERCWRWHIESACPTYQVSAARAERKRGFCQLQTAVGQRRREFS